MLDNSPIDKMLKLLSKEGERPNFLFIGDSVLHIAVFNAWLQKLRDQGIRPRGVVCNSIPPGKIPQYDEADIVAIDRDDFKYLRLGVDYRLPSGFTEKMNEARALRKNIQLGASDSGDPFYLVHPATGHLGRRYYNAAMNYSRSIIDVAIEEGVGTYVQNSATWDAYSFVGRKQSLKLVIQKALKSINRRINARQTKMLNDFFSERQRFCMFSSEEDRLRENETFLKYTAASFRIIGDRKGVHKQNFRNSIVIAASPAFEYVNCTDLDMQVYEHIVKVAQEKGIRVFIKTHPREKLKDRYKQLNAEVLDERTSIESILAVSDEKPLAAFGFFSTSLITSRVLWGIPGVSLNNLVDDERMRFFLDSGQRTNTLFSDYLIIPYTVNDLISCITDIKMADE